jgi:hypothetical protein
MKPPGRSRLALEWLAARQRDASLNFARGFGTGDIDASVAQAIEEGLYPPGTDPAVLRDRLISTLQVEYPECWSVSESPAHRFYLDRAEQHVLTGLTRLGRQIPNQIPAIGTLPTFRANALAIRIPGTSESVIAFESGLLDLTSKWAVFLAASLSGYRSEALTGLFIDLMFCQVGIGSTGYLGGWVVHPEIRQRGAATVQPAMDTFVMGHEYAHVVFSHGFGEDRHRHDLELQADRYAFEVTMSAYKNNPAAYGCSAALLRAWQLIERGNSFVAHEPGIRSISASHPSAQDRQLALQAIARASMTASQFAEISQYMGAFEAETSRLWEPLENAFWQLRTILPEGWIPDNPEHKRSMLEEFLRLM